MKKKTFEEVARMTELVAKKQGWALNGDADFYADLVEGLQANFNRYGYFLCPCRDSHGSREKDRPALCPCTWAPADIAEFGHCFCALYLSPEFAASRKSPEGIPDRDNRGED